MNANESKDTKFPLVPESLVVKLQQQIPERCPKLDETEREIFFYAGQRAVVDMLSSIFKEQQES